MTTRGSQTIKYDPENRPLSVLVNPQIQVKFAYDGDEMRRKRLDVNGVVHYLGTYELTNNFQGGTQASKYYVATLGKLTRLIAFSRGGALYFVGNDHLGSTIKVATNVNGTFTAQDQLRYCPSGRAAMRERP
jgi:YD repeat-containing protein